MENWYTPAASSALPLATRVLVLAPHPDDEIFGCGGALALYRDQCAQIHVHVLTDGAGYALEAERIAIHHIRQAETQAALQGLGLEHASFAGLPDRSLAAHTGLAHQVIQQIEQHKADVVLAPSLWEIHPDHLATGRAAWAAVTTLLRQGGSVPTLLFYEIGAPQRVDLLVDITSVWPEKYRAMQCFLSQQQQQDYARHIEALNVYRTYTLPSSVRQAEAFSMVTPEQLAALVQLGGDPAQRGMDRWIESALVAATAHTEALTEAFQAGQRRCLQESQQMQLLLQELQQMQLLLQDAHQERCAMQSVITQSGHEHQQLLNSTSWRITAPLRWLGQMLRRLR